MPPRSLFILLIFLWSFAETLLVPFYPQFFEQVYHISNPNLTGFFFAGCRLILIFSYPFWVKMEKKFSTGKTLIFGQVVGGCLCGVSIFAPDVTVFIAVFSLMVAVKGSYLLIYPLLMEYGGGNQKKGLIGKVAFVTHGGMILAALLAGSLIKQIDLRWLLVINMLFDFMQAGISYILHKRIIKQKSIQQDILPEQSHTYSAAWYKLPKPLWLLGTMIFVLYFAIYVIRPFFTKYLEAGNLVVSDYSLYGLLFSIPSIAALCCAPFLEKLLSRFSAQVFGLFWTILAGVGVLLQVLTNELIPFLVGRIGFGVSAFFLCGLMDYCLFQQSKKNQATSNYSISTTAQNLARIAAPVSAGFAVEHYTLNTPFYLSALAFLPLLGALSFYTYTLKRSKQPRTPQVTAASTAARLY